MRHHLLLLLVLTVSSLDHSQAGKSITFGSRLVRKDGKHNDLLVPANRRGDAADTSTTDAESIAQSSFEFTIASKPATIVNNEAGDEKTVEADKDGPRRQRSLRRKRRTKEELPVHYHRETEKEEQLYWVRFLADNLGSMTEPMTVSNDNMNTDTGGGSGATDDTGSSTGTGSATTTTTTDGDAAAFPPGPCPTRVSLDCVSISDATMKCTDFVRPPTVQENDDCYASVEFLIYLSNAGNDVQRVYELSLTQSGDVTSFEDIVAGSLDLIPGEVAMVSLDAVINICTNDPDMAFDTQVDIISGPPCNIEVRIIFCISLRCVMIVAHTNNLYPLLLSIDFHWLRIRRRRRMHEYFSSTQRRFLHVGNHLYVFGRKYRRCRCQYYHFPTIS